VFNNPVVLSLRDIEDGKMLKKVSFDLHRGEILAIGGMTGNGQREMIRLLFGASPMKRGAIFFKGKR
ncbi:MAG: D-xylose ABC transporter ATP-binding protein, partial [Atribacterota bacterium]